MLKGRKKIILGAVGVLQFDVVAHRLLNEYRVECLYDSVNIAAVRWIKIQDPEIAKKFKEKCAAQLALDSAGQLTYLATSHVNLSMTMERWPEVVFLATREH